MTYSKDVFRYNIGYVHPGTGLTTALMDTDLKCSKLLELINQLESRISDLEDNS